MKVSNEIRKCILAACKSDADSWTNGNAPEIILDALDELSEEAKLELVLRFLPADHDLIKRYASKRPGIRVKGEKPRDYTPSSEGRGIGDEC